MKIECSFDRVLCSFYMKKEEDEEVEFYKESLRYVMKSSLDLINSFISLVIAIQVTTHHSRKA